MQNIMAPEAVTRKIMELNKIIEENPVFIPLGVIAKFLGADDGGIRAYLDNAAHPFGISWQQITAVNLRSRLK